MGGPWARDAPPGAQQSRTVVPSLKADIASPFVQEPGRWSWEAGPLDISGRGHVQESREGDLRNQIEVRDQISRLEQIVRFGPLEAAVEQARFEEGRRQEAVNKDRAQGDAKSLGRLDPVTVKESTSVIELDGESGKFADIVTHVVVLGL